VDHLEDARVGPRRPHAEAALDLVGPRELLSGKPRRDARDRSELATEPAPAVVLEVHVLETVQEHGRLVTEHRRFREVFLGDGSGPLRRTDVGVDEPIEVTTHPQAESDVAFRGLHPITLAKGIGGTRKA
jgi:hypothetical protein